MCARWFVSSLAYEGGRIVAVRQAGNAERYELTSPAVVSVTSDICAKRIPSMRDLLDAGKKPVQTQDAPAGTPDRTVTVKSRMAKQADCRQILTTLIQV